MQTRYLLAMIGAQPHTDWLPPELARDEKGFILTGDAVPPAFRHSHEWSALGRAPYLYETSLPGVFAVGDVRAGSVKRVAAPRAKGAWRCGWRSNTLAWSRHSDHHVRRWSGQTLMT